VKTSIGEWESPEERLEHAPRPRRRERPERSEHSKPSERGERSERVGPGGASDNGVPPESEPEAEEVEVEQSEAAPPEPARPDAPQSEDGDEPDRDTVKLFVNRGERSGIEEEDLRWALREGAVLPEEAIHEIRVLHRFSFVEVAPDQAERAVEFLDGTKLKGKEIRLEIAKS
jgi:hypothetical protein